MTKNGKQWHDRVTKYSVGNVNFWAFGDRVIVEEDPFMSGYECSNCHGKGTVACLDCDDSGRSKLNSEIVCKRCGGTKKRVCLACQGKGGTLVIPDVAQARPTTGIVVSAGPDTKFFQVGDGVVYHNFAGNKIDIDLKEKKVVLKILHESEILSRVEGHLLYRVGQTE